MRFDPVGIWEARLRGAPAASAAEAILAALLGYRDSHLLHADDVAQLASALEAWGTLVLGGNRADGSPYVPPTEGERASAQASLKARAFVNRSEHIAQTTQAHNARLIARVTGQPLAQTPPADDSTNPQGANDHDGAPDA